GRDHLTGRRLQKHRDIYHSTVLKWLEIANEQVLNQIRQTFEQFFDGRFCIGVHRRVGNPMVANLQNNGTVPSIELFIKTVEWILSTLTKEDIPDYVIFL